MEENAVIEELEIESNDEVQESDDLDINNEAEELVEDSDEDNPDTDNDDIIDDLNEDVEYEGKQYKLPKELKEALLRQGDYTRKTQEVAEQRKTLETQRTQAEQAIQTVQHFQKEFAELSGIDNQIAQFQQLDWNAAINENPVEAQKLQVRFNELRLQREQAANNIQNLQGQVEQNRQAEMQRQVQLGEAQLTQRIPGWNQEMKQGIAEAGRDLGFGVEELSQLTDPRMVEALYYAKIGREKMNKLKKDKPAKPIKPTSSVKSGTSKQRFDEDKMTDEQWSKWYRGNQKKQRR